MKYLILTDNAEEGGVSYEFIDFDGDIKEAHGHFGTMIAYPPGDDYFALEGETDLNEAWVIQIYPGNNLKINLEALRDAHYAREARTDAEIAEAIERAEFDARMKEKYG